MKYLFLGILVLYISNALAFNITDISNILNKNIGKSTNCGLKIFNYGVCLTNLGTAILGRNEEDLESNNICPIYNQNFCKDFVNDMLNNNVECDDKFGEIIKYSITLYRLYYLSFCTRTTDGKICPVTNLIKTQKFTIDNINESLRNSCSDTNCNKAFVATANIMNKNIRDLYLYDYYLGFTTNISYRAIAKSFEDNKCSNIDFINSNKELFLSIEDLNESIINIIYKLSLGEVPNFSDILIIASSAKVFVEQEISNECLSQFKNYDDCFKLFSNYQKESIKGPSDVVNMCKKFEDKKCSNLLSDLKENKVNCGNTLINDTVYRAVFIALRLTYISACTKTSNNNDYCPIAKFLQTSHKIGETVGDFLQAVTDNCEDDHCNDEFYKITDLITESNIYDAIIPDEFNYEKFFEKFKKHTCKAFNIGLGIFKIIEDILALVREILIEVIDIGFEIINGVAPDYASVKSVIETMDSKTNIFGINRKCLSQVWRYSSCVKLFISNSSYNDIKNITTNDICNIFEDKNCEAFVSDLLSEDSACINEDSDHEKLYKEIHSTLKLTYLSTCSKTKNDEYCPMAEFLKTNTNITLAGTEKYREALKSTCEDTNCNKSYSKAFKIIQEAQNEEVKTRRKRSDEIDINAGENGKIEIDLDEAINLLDKNKCGSFAKTILNENSNSFGELKSKVSMISLLLSLLTIIFIL